MQMRGTRAKKMLAVASVMIMCSMAVIPIPSSQAKTVSAQTSADACPAKGFLESALEELLKTVTPGDLVYYQALLAQGASREQVVEMILQSVENRTQRVSGFFQKFLGRPANQSELDLYTAALQQGMTEEELITTILSSPEYAQNHGGGTNEGFLDQLFQDLLGRPIDASNRTIFLNLLQTSFSRAQIVQLILKSDEYRKKEVDDYFHQFLGRAATPQELAFFVSAREQGLTKEQLIAAILGSFEYCVQASRPITIAPLDAFFGLRGGNGTIYVTAPKGHPWEVQERINWITITSDATGIGSGKVTYRVTANMSGQSRRATLTVDGKPFFVWQEGPQVFIGR